MGGSVEARLEANVEKLGALFAMKSTENSQVGAPDVVGQDKKLDDGRVHLLRLFSGKLIFPLARPNLPRSI